jgi:hypothetical protein
MRYGYQRIRGVIECGLRSRGDEKGSDVEGCLGSCVRPWRKLMHDSAVAFTHGRAGDVRMVVIGRSKRGFWPSNIGKWIRDPTPSSR